VGGVLRVWGGGGRDRPEAACPPETAADGEAGGFNAVQKLFTNRGSRQWPGSGQAVVPGSGRR
jgi:hypothetical protein